MRDLRAPLRLLTMITASLLILCALVSGPVAQAAMPMKAPMAASMDMAGCPDMPAAPVDCADDCAILCLAIRPIPPQVHYLPRPAPVLYSPERQSRLTELNPEPEPPVPRDHQASEQSQT